MVSNEPVKPRLGGPEQGIVVQVTNEGNFRTEGTGFPYD